MENETPAIANEIKDVVNSPENEVNEAPKPKKKKGFSKGNPIGVRFGEGQPTNLGGRPLGGMSIMKQAMKLYEDNALAAAQYLLQNALDPNMDPKLQFPWFKELNSRILGAAKGSAEDIVNKLAEKLEGTVSLSRPALEATAMGDAKALIKELHNQGVLDKVIEEVKGESQV